MLFNNILFEAGDFNADENEPSEFKSLKKYHLVQQLTDLESKMKQNDLNTSDLNTILTFKNELSYDTLLQLTQGILTIVSSQINNSQQDSNSDTAIQQPIGG